MRFKNTKLQFIVFSIVNLILSSWHDVKRRSRTKDIISVRANNHKVTPVSSVEELSYR